MSVYYGVCIGNDDKFEQYALPGIRTVGDTDRLLTSRGNNSIFIAYNRMLEDMRECEDLEALVLLHEDLEIRDVEFEAKIHEQFRADDVAILGTVGGRGPTSVRWSQARQRLGRQPDSLHENDFGGGYHDVDIVDGCLLVLSPWAVQRLRFDDQRFVGFHAYDADICMQARRQGRRVRVVEFDTFHHTKGGFGDISTHQRADDTFRRKWGLPLAPLHKRWIRRYPRLGRQVGRAVRRWR